MKAAWPSEDALLEALYLVIRDITRKWAEKIQGWGRIPDRLVIYFDDWIIERELA